MRKGKVSTEYDNVNVHMIFEIKMDRKLTRKSILVADDHTTAPPSSITYLSVFYIKVSVLRYYLNILITWTYLHVI